MTDSEFYFDVKVICESKRLAQIALAARFNEEMKLGFNYTIEVDPEPREGSPGDGPSVEPRPQIPDLSDPDVREMVERRHDPEETWTNSGVLLAVYCGACGNAWPCPTRLALRDLRAR